MGRYDYSEIDFENKTLREIEKEMGIPYVSLLKYCKKNNIKFKRGKRGHSKTNYITKCPVCGAEWPKAIIVAKDIVDENDAIKRCEEMFRLD